MKIYTRTGDKGKTSLFTGDRVPKSDLRVEAYGTVDELNAWLGLIHSEVKDTDIQKLLIMVQNQLFDLGADLATPENKAKNSKQKRIPRINQSRVSQLENWIDQYQEILPPLRNFILPGGSIVSCYFQISRGICRRAERIVVKLGEKETYNPEVLKYLNRLSDLLFVLARIVNYQLKIDDVHWKPVN